MPGTNGYVAYVLPAGTKSTTEVGAQGEVRSSKWFHSRVAPNFALRISNLLGVLMKTFRSRIAVACAIGVGRRRDRQPAGRRPQTPAAAVAARRLAELQPRPRRRRATRRSSRSPSATSRAEADGPPRAGGAVPVRGHTADVRSGGDRVVAVDATLARKRGRSRFRASCAAPRLRAPQRRLLDRKPARSPRLAARPAAPPVPVGQGGGAPAAPAGGGRAGGGRAGGRRLAAARGAWRGAERLRPRCRLLARRRHAGTAHPLHGRQQSFALDAATGKPSAGFGEDGPTRVRRYGGTPTIYRNVAIIGAATSEMPPGDPGNPRAFDVRHRPQAVGIPVRPAAGQRYNETWGNVAREGSRRGWHHRGTNMWGFSAPVDVKHGIVIVPLGSPAPNYWGGDRPGANLFGNSLVALDAGPARTSGTSRPCTTTSGTPTSRRRAADRRRHGQHRPGHRHVDKTSLFFLDRETGKPLSASRNAPFRRATCPASTTARPSRSRSTRRRSAASA